MEFLPGPTTLHKYAYADDDPVNQIDPTGDAALAEDTTVEIKIDLGALPAVAAVGCAVEERSDVGHPSNHKYLLHATFA
jgi:hypothetical protein